MFTAKLFDFQTKHEESLLAKCADHEELVLSAPTGAGKTVIVSKFIDDYLDENPNTVFLWLCPGAGGLEKQSQDSFREVTSGIPDGDVYAFINESDPRGKVFFINWDKINRTSNVVLREGEHRDLMGKVLFCHTNGIDIFMLIDEEHKYQATANEYIGNIQPVHVLRISATPVSKGDHTEIIPKSSRTMRLSAQVLLQQEYPSMKVFLSPLRKTTALTMICFCLILPTKNEKRYKLNMTTGD